MDDYISCINNIKRINKEIKAKKEEKNKIKEEI